MTQRVLNTWIWQCGGVFDRVTNNRCAVQPRSPPLSSNNTVSTQFGLIITHSGNIEIVYVATL